VRSLLFVTMFPSANVRFHDTLSFLAKPKAAARRGIRRKRIFRLAGISRLRSVSERCFRRRAMKNSGAHLYTFDRSLRTVRHTPP